MKVLHVIAISGVGGAEKLLIDLVQEQSRQGLNVSCILFYKMAHEQVAKELGECMRQSAANLEYRSFTRVLSGMPVTALHTFIKINQPDIIHSHLKQADTWLAILKWRRKISVPVVATLHGYRDRFHNQYGLKWNKKVQFTMYYWLTRFVGSQLDRFIAISKGIATLFSTANLISENKMETIYHGIEFTPATESHPLSNDAYRLVMIGRLVPFKGHRFAIAAIGILKEKYTNLTLDIFGAGPEEEKLKTLVTQLKLTDHVIFRGFQPNVLQHLANYRIAVLPSLGEPFGMVFLEAFKAGVPVVSFDLPAANEIIENNENGLLARPYDAADLANKIELLLNDSSLCSLIVDKAYGVLQSKFSLQKMAALYLDFYKQTIAQKISA